jgi:acyl transferase domain-containing protein
MQCGFCTSYSKSSQAVHCRSQVSWELMAAQLPLLAAATAAGAAPEAGVYVGIQQMEYAAMAAPHLHSFGPYNASGSPFSVAAGRLSFTYGLKGACAFRSSIQHC